MSRTRLAIAAAACAALASAPSAALASPAGSPRATATGAAALPPSLTALEQKMLALQVSSERFSLSETVSGSEAPSGPLGSFGRAARAHAAALLTLVTATGEIGFEPLQARFETTVLGIKSAGRVIGSTAYIEVPEFAKIDGGRPWLEQRDVPLEKATGTELTGLGASPNAGTTEAFGTLVLELNRASSIVEVGPRTIDGQPVTVFRAAVDLHNFGHETSAQRNDLLKAFKPSVRVETMIAADGAPVRELVTLSTRRGHAQLIAQQDLLSLNEPVAPVQAPPASQTITQAQLDAIEQREARHIRALARKHRRKHG